MEKVQISKADEGWLVTVAGRDRFAYKRLADAVRRAGDIVGESTPGRHMPSIQFDFTDDFMNEAISLHRTRVELGQRERELAREIDGAIVMLAKEGLSNGDIATVLGLTPSRVSQLVQDGAALLWGEDDPHGELHLVKLKVGKGWRAGSGRGPLPDTITYGGELYERVGMASSVGGQPWKHTYQPAARS